MQLIVENVRGFAGRHVIPIGPLTVLVGENSAGKSTILALLTAVLNPEFPFGENLFNRAPFELGSFDTIATYKGGKYGRAESFTIGYEERIKTSHLLLEGTYVNHLGAPRLQKFQMSNNLVKLQVDLDRKVLNATTISNGKPISKEFSFGEDKTYLGRISGIEWFPSIVADLFFGQHSRKTKTTKAEQRLLELMFNLVNALRRARRRVVSLAPLRTKPHRTYDELIDEFNPGGDHVPLILARALTAAGTESDKLLKGLERFGRASGLFTSIRIKRMGKRPSDPFQLRVKGHGPDVNLVDVGYGVSQALPIVVDSILASKGNTLLVQQPEVHLHPRAQSALGAFFARETKETGKNFIIETHSDFLVDRIRIEIGNGEISVSDVQIIFLEKGQTSFSVHPLQLDSRGTIVTPPQAYRSFFLEEELSLISRGVAR